VKLHGAILFVKDLDRMASFYGETLGLPALPASCTTSWLSFEAGFGLHAIPPHIADEIEITNPPRIREETPIKLIFTVTDLAGEVSRLQAPGVQLELKPWGAADGIDPEGNVFQLVGV
jgi:catechol 2,3-dioxygenase-like lactoylglutathione lyase family enzyme